MGNMMKLWKTLMWVAAVPIFGLQALALYAINDAKNRGNIDMALFPAVAAIVLLLAAMILVCALKEKKASRSSCRWCRACFLVFLRARYTTCIPINSKWKASTKR